MDLTSWYQRRYRVPDPTTNYSCTKQDLNFLASKAKNKNNDRHPRIANLTRINTHKKVDKVNHRGLPSDTKRS